MVPLPLKTPLKGPTRLAALPLVDIHTQLPQFHLGRFDLAHQLFVCLGTVVKGEDAPAETDEKVCAE